jgi:TRAP-type mannitol/chloroaromatic compound transport system substrate-binding protein
MERRLFVRGAGLAGSAAGAAALVACGKKEEPTPAPAKVAAPAVVSKDEIRWRIASSFPKSLDTLFGVNDVFAKSISEMSGGKFTITTHAAGELMPAFGVLDGVSNGTVEMANTAPYYFFGKDPTYALDCAIPFGLNQRQMNAWMIEGGGLGLLREFYASVNVVNFPMGNTGAQMGGWYRKEIKSVADLKGLKFRVGGFGGKVIERLGVVPQNIPGGEVYQALEKGTIDAAEWVGPYDDEKLGFNKVAPFYYYPGWWEIGPQLSLYVNQKAYDGLSSEYKAMIWAASQMAGADMVAKYDARNPAALKRLVAGGAKILRFPKDVMDASFKSAMEVYAELNASNPAWKKIYESYSNFRRDQNLWFRFSESASNDFMQAQKL